jgi:hypothetical protein
MNLEEKILDLLAEKKIAYDKSFKIKAWDLKKLCNPSLI